MLNMIHTRYRKHLSSKVRKYSMEGCFSPLTRKRHRAVNLENVPNLQMPKVRSTLVFFDSAPESCLCLHYQNLKCFIHMLKYSFRRLTENLAVKDLELLSYLVSVKTKLRVCQDSATISFELFTFSTHFLKNS